MSGNFGFGPGFNPDDFNPDDFNPDDFKSDAIQSPNSKSYLPNSLTLD